MRPIFSSSGGGPNIEKGHDQFEQPIEQVGSFDPMPNERNEKLASFNFERLQYWIGEGAEVSRPVAQLLGLAGFLPVHPRTYMVAWRKRERRKQASQEPQATKQ